jgi:hypothetical protein
MKICRKCNIEKPFECFGKRKASKDGLKSWCKECEADDAKLRRKNNPEKAKEIDKQSRIKNRKKRIEESKKWRASKLVYAKNYQKKYRQQDEVKIRRRKEAEKYRRKIGIPLKTKMSIEEYLAKANIRAKRYYQNNKLKVNNFKKHWSRNKLKIDVQYRLRRRLSTRIYHALKGSSKSDFTINLIGCSIEALMKHLEAKFSHGMTWNNYGAWHVDHIVPCAYYDLTDENEQRKCFNYKNLQPLWAFANMSKGARHKQISNDIVKS